MALVWLLVDILSGIYELQYERTRRIIVEIHKRCTSDGRKSQHLDCHLSFTAEHRQRLQNLEINNYRTHIQRIVYLFSLYKVILYTMFGTGSDNAAEFK